MIKGVVTSPKLLNYTVMWAPLLLLLTIQATTGAPTLGDDLTANLKKNMAAVHGNIMAGITNILKPLLDLVDKVTNALLFRGRKVAEPSRNFVSNMILGGVGALNSGIKLASTLIAAPFKLAGDGMMALERVVLGRSMDMSSQKKKRKRDLDQMTLEQLMDGALKALKELLDENGNLKGLSTKHKRQVKPKFLEGLTETLDRFNDFIAEKANEDGDFLLFLGQLFARN